jgi:hypothetical protein
MLRIFGKTLGIALAALFLVSTLAVVAQEKKEDTKEATMEMTCVKSDGKGSCVVGTMPNGQELVLHGSGMKEGETMLCTHKAYMIHCVPVPSKKQ